MHVVYPEARTCIWAEFTVKQFVTVVSLRYSLLLFPPITQRRRPEKAEQDAAQGRECGWDDEAYRPDPWCEVRRDVPCVQLWDDVQHIWPGLRRLCWLKTGLTFRARPRRKAETRRPCELDRYDGGCAEERAKGAVWGSG